jgi:hypothetical protein
VDRGGYTMDRVKREEDAHIRNREITAAANKKNSLLLVAELKKYMPYEYVATTELAKKFGNLRLVMLAKRNPSIFRVEAQMEKNGKTKPNGYPVFVTRYYISLHPDICRELEPKRCH